MPSSYVYTVFISNLILVKFLGKSIQGNFPVQWLVQAAFFKTRAELTGSAPEVDVIAYTAQ